MRPSPQHLLRWAKGLTLISHVALIVLVGGRGQLLGIIAAALLATALPGLLRERRRSYQWASLLVVFYCALWLADGWAGLGDRRLSFAIASVAALDFVSLLAFARLSRPGSLPAGRTASQAGPH